MNNKSTMTDYVDWRGDLEFSRDPLNEVDCLIFATLSYIDFESVPFVGSANIKSAPVLSEVYECVKDVKCFGSMFMDLCRKCAQSQRYKNTKVMFYQSITSQTEQTQFSATTFVIETGQVVVAFRGTDDSFVGWQEDFNMSVGVIPAHKYARRYINDVMLSLPSKEVHIAGHSKGGNLSVWAASHMYDEHFSRLKKVYDFDGPGFCDDFIHSDEYKRIIDKTTKYVVDVSIIGMLLSSATPQVVIESKSYTTMFQHLTTSWLVMGTNLCRLENRSARGVNIQLIVEDLVGSLTIDERKILTAKLAEFINLSGLRTFSDIKSIENISKIFETLKSSSSSSEEKLLMQSIAKRFATIVKNRALSGFDKLGGEKNDNI